MDSLWSRDELLALIAAWKAAYKAASTGKSYQIDGRMLSRQDVPEILRQLKCLRKELAALSGKGRGPTFVTARVRR